MVSLEFNSISEIPISINEYELIKKGEKSLLVNDCAFHISLNEVVCLIPVNNDGELDYKNSLYVFVTGEGGKSINQYTLYEFISMGYKNYDDCLTDLNKNYMDCDGDTQLHYLRFKVVENIASNS